jgi:hypothetical protein
MVSSMQKKRKTTATSHTRRKKTAISKLTSRTNTTEESEKSNITKSSKSKIAQNVPSKCLLSGTQSESTKYGIKQATLQFEKNQKKLTPIQKKRLERYWGITLEEMSQKLIDCGYWDTNHEARFIDTTGDLFSGSIFEDHRRYIEKQIDIICYELRNSNNYTLTNKSTDNYNINQSSEQINLLDGLL